MKKTALIPCRQPGCKHEPFDTPQGEAMHYNRVHSRLILVPKQKGQKNGHSHEPIKLSPPRSEASAPPAETAPRLLKKQTALKHRRKYTKRQKAESTANVDILFCPRCLTDLHAVGIGMAMANVNSTVNGCPKCGLDLRIVAVGMALKQAGKG
jgi:hypothetical protein